MSYYVFRRTWWKPNRAWPNGLEPCAGEKTIMETDIETEKEARDIAQEWNRNHDPGPYSLKAEYDEE